MAAAVIIGRADTAETGLSCCSCGRVCPDRAAATVGQVRRCHAAHHGRNRPERSHLPPSESGEDYAEDLAGIGATDRIPGPYSRYCDGEQDDSHDGYGEEVFHLAHPDPDVMTAPPSSPS